MRNDCKVGDVLKKRRWLIVLVIAMIGMIVSGIQLMMNRDLSLMLLIGIMTIYLSMKMRNRFRLLSSMGIFLGILLIIITGLSTAGIWIALVALLLCVLLGFDKLTSTNFWNAEQWFWQKKSYVSVKVKKPSTSHQSERYAWIGTQQIGQDAFEWDDINIAQFAGDTIIDLGNTILPQQENVIVVRKGIGRVRILVPYGIGIKVYHHAFLGELRFQNQQLELKNESVKLYSDNYETSTKTIKIISTIMVGAVEVIEV